MSRLIAPLLWLALVLLSAPSGRAQDEPARRWLPKVALQGTDVRVNGQLVLRVRRRNGSLGPAERANLTAERLREAVRDGLTGAQVRVDVESETRSRTVRRYETRMVERTVRRRVGSGKKRRYRRVTIEVPRRVRVRATERYTVESEARLVALGKTIAVARVDDAKAAQMEKPSQLARTWEEALARALEIPGLSVGEASQILPLGERRVLPLGGVARGPITLRRLSGASSPVEATVVGGTVVLAGRSIGRDTVLLEREGAQARIDIRVQQYAAQASPPRPVEVTGRGIRPDQLARLVAARARESFTPLPGASVRVEDEPRAVQAPARGKSVAVSVLTSATGADLLPLRREVTVPVVSRALPAAETAALFFSNNPERIPDFGTLFTGRLDMGTARLLYHHQNGLSSPVWFVVELINDGDAPLQVQVVGGDAGPVRDTVWVGFRAASDFLTDVSSDSGVVLEIPARSRLALRTTRMPPGLTISGLMQLRQVSGGAPLVRVAADRLGDSLSVPETLRAYPVHEALVQEAARLSDHVYPKPAKRLEARYTVGGRWAFLSVGRAPIGGANGEKSLEGNYGVFYDIVVALENPTDRPAEVRVLFEPAAGLTGAVFVIEGKRVEIPQTNLPTESVLARFRLAPGQKRTIRMRTLPLSGSNYPVNLVVRTG